MKRLIILIWVLILFSPSGVLARKRSPSLAEQDAFVKRYNEAYEAGEEAFEEFQDDVMANGSPEEIEMLGNMNQGKRPDGRDYVPGKGGFMGDRNDPGPVDWSDWDIITDANGNVIGFKEKYFEDKDIDGDGKISDEERNIWNDKKKKEYEQAGGPPGQVPPIPEWDKDQDGRPDPGFERFCWQCRHKPLKKRHKCLRGMQGSCASNPCRRQNKCLEHQEIKKDGTRLACYECLPDETPIAWCEAKGYFSSPDCNGVCPNDVCVGIDVDVKSGKPVNAAKSREKGSEQNRCYACMKQAGRGELRYVVVIIETPYGRYVLRDRTKKGGSLSLSRFIPASIMALARVSSSELSALQQLAEMSKGGVTVGTIQEIANMLKDKLANKDARYNGSCFDNFTAKKPLQQPPSMGIIRNKRGKRTGYSTHLEAAFGRDDTKDITVDGPILACGQINGQDALAIFDVNGALVGNILKKEFVNNPNLIVEMLTKAADAYQRFQSVRDLSPQDVFKKLTCTIVEKIVTLRRSEQDFKKFKKEKAKRDKLQADNPVEPNDPLYYHIPQKKKKLLGFFGSSKKVISGVSLGIGIGLGKNGIALAKKKGADIKGQWGIQAVGYLPKSNSNSAWNFVDASKPNVVVAVIDSGLDMSHPDGPQFIWTNEGEIPDNGKDDDKNGYIDDVYGWNFLDNNNDLTDYKGHGTFVAGIIAARSNNGIGIAGINPGAVIMPLKVADNEGHANSLDIARAIYYAVNNGARVINISLGGRGFSRLEQAAINYAYSNGVFVVVASGNTGDYIGDIGPASAYRALAVGAVDYDRKRSTISSFGPNNGIMAPGEDIYSIRSIDSFHKRAYAKDSLQRWYFRQSGTSFAAPMVAATASLMLAKNSTLTNLQLKDILLATATDMDERGWDGMTGSGMLDAAAALRAVNKNDFLVAMLNEFRINKDDRKRLISVDVFATVHGSFSQFTVEIGKGKRPGKFKEIAGPFNAEADNAWVVRIDKGYLRGSKEWVVRLKVIDKEGNPVYAQAELKLK